MKPAKKQTPQDLITVALYEVLFSVRTLDRSGALESAIAQTQKVASMLQKLSTTAKKPGCKKGVTP